MTKLQSGQAMRKLIALIVRWSWFMGVCIVLAAIGALITSQLQSPVYRATTLVLVDSRPTGQDTYSDLQASNQLVTTYASLITQPVVLQRAIRQVGGTSAADLGTQVHVSTQTGTQILQIQVDNSDPQRAAALANALANALTAQLAVDNLANSTNIRIFQPATPPATPYQPRPALFGLGGGVLGLMLSVAIIAVVESVDKRVRTAEDVEDLTGQPPLATIEMAEERGHAPREVTAPAHAAQTAVPVPVAFGANAVAERAEGYRLLRTNLDLAGTDHPSRTILVTSPGAHHGAKSICATNLALSMAQASIHALLVDADLEHPAIHSLLGLENEYGLSTYLSNPAVNGDHALAWATLPGVPNLAVLTAGPHRPGNEDVHSRQPRWLQDLVPPNTSRDVQQSERFEATVVVDGPPIAATADALILAAQAEMTILVVDVGRTRQEELVKAQVTLKRAHARLAGVVLSQPVRTRWWRHTRSRDATRSTRRPPTARGSRTAVHSEALVSDATH